MSKLWIFLQNNLNNYIYIYITVNNKPLPQYYIDYFNILGINSESLIHITRPTSFKEIIIPDNCFFNNKKGERYFTKEYIKLLNLAKNNCYSFCKKELSYNKVFLTRKSWNKKREYGEDKFVKFYMKRGYKCIYPEQLSITEQIALYSNCKNLVTTECSTSHNVVFMPNKSNLTILKKANYRNGYQPAVNDVNSLKVKWISVSIDFFNNNKTPWNGPFFIYINNFFKKANKISKPTFLLLNTDFYKYFFKESLIFIKFKVKKLLQILHLY